MEDLVLLFITVIKHNAEGRIILTCCITHKFYPWIFKAKRPGGIFFANGDWLFLFIKVFIESLD